MARRQKTYHIIYKTTCKTTNKFYVGMHSTDNLDDGYLGSGRRLRYSINKYGEENHFIKILEYCTDREALKKREAEIVNETFLENDLCMNLKVGGEGNWDNVNKNYPQEKRKENGKRWGKQLRENLKNKEFREKYSKKKSKELKKSYKNGNRSRGQFVNWNDKKHTEETKQKIGKANSKHQSGSGNSQFGTCWICKDSEVKKISKDNLQKHLENGWKRGRK